MKYLISVQETYRVDTDQEATRLIEASKHDPDYSLTKYNSVYKEKKQDGEVVEDWFRVTLTKVYDNEKEPTGTPITIQEDF